ncbi:uncharacterized protein LOC142319895 [Lycorma delicatula]|uniref:uncharacterized protein LOC142319895 n=1 Tax=Lycorma delicatula TaxID=130591 RepID=UPI003F515ACE
MNTTFRDDLGRYCVQIPLKADICELGESKDSAFRRFLSLERRLSVNPEMRSQYIQFMKEYEELGHMKEITMAEVNSSKAYYIHHVVLREDSTTTKLRVVFNAFSKTSSGVSLNDISIVGPTVQSNRVSIVSRFRIHTYVVNQILKKCIFKLTSNQLNKSTTNLLERPARKYY